MFDGVFDGLPVVDETTTAGRNGPESIKIREASTPSLELHSWLGELKSPAWMQGIALGRSGDVCAVCRVKAVHTLKWSKRFCRLEIHMQ